MEKHLFNFAYIPQWPIQGLEHEEKLEIFLRELQLDGIELMVYDSSIDNSAYAKFAVGAHLKYWPCWLPLYEKNEQLLSKLYPSIETRHNYYGAYKYEDWLEQIRQNIKGALKVAPEYLVWHIADSTIEEAFSYNFKHSNMDVLRATIAVVREVINEIPENVKLLFENLWWPGLTLTEPKEIEYLLDSLSSYNVGLMLDTGHLLNTDWTATNEAEGIKVLLKKIQNLGSLKKEIRGMHLNMSLSASYRRAYKGDYQLPVTQEQVMEHIHAIDQHRAFTDQSIGKLLELVEPEYINHELYFNNKVELAGLLCKQLKACGR